MIYCGKAWDEDRWQSQSVEDYLPPGVTIEDYEETRALKKADYAVSETVIASQLGKLTEEERSVFEQ